MGKPQSKACEALLKDIQTEERTLGELQNKLASDLARNDLVAVQDDKNGIQIVNQILDGLRQKYSQMGCGELPFPKPTPLPQKTHLLVSNLGTTSSVLRFDGTTGAFIDVLAEVFPNGDDASLISDLVLGPNNDVYALIPNYQKLIVINGSSGNFGDFADSAIVAWAAPDVVAFGPDNNFYIGDGGHVIQRAIGKYSGSNGAFLGVVAPLTANIIGGGDLIFGPDGNLYNACFFSDNRILQISPISGNILRVFASTASAEIVEDGPGAMAFGPDGDLYVGTGYRPASASIAAVLRYDGNSGAYKGIFVSAHSGGVRRPVGLAFGPAPSHDLFISDTDGGILRYDRHTGAFKGVFVPPGSGGLSSPGKLLFRPI